MSEKKQNTPRKNHFEKTKTKSREYHHHSRKKESTKSKKESQGSQKESDFENNYDFLPFQEECLLTPEILKRGKSPVRNANLSQKQLYLDTFSPMNQEKMEPQEIRNHILDALKLRPQGHANSLSNESKTKIIENHILGLLKQSSNSMLDQTLIEGGFSSPKRDLSPNSNSDRWAGLSSSPAPNQLPLPAFNGEDSSILKTDLLPNSSPSIIPPKTTVQITPQRLFHKSTPSNKTSPNKKNNSRKQKPNSETKIQNATQAQQLRKSKNIFVKTSNSQDLRSIAPSSLDSMSSHLRTILNITGDGFKPQVQVAH